MAVATFLFALVAAIVGFVLSYFAAGFGVFASFAIGYLAGSLLAVIFVFVFMILKPKTANFHIKGITSRFRS